MINTESLIDTGAIETLVKNKVAETIVSEINNLLANPDELLDLIKRDATVLLVKQLASEIQSTVEIETKVSQHANKLLEQRINTNTITDLIYKHIKAPVEAEVNELLKNDTNISNIIESQVVNAFRNQLGVKFDNLDITALINSKINELFNTHIGVTQVLLTQHLKLS